ncbi:MAG: hypothetical protein IT380_18600 [Myxococcales bacterium]|nr:hypothetical protein [Myxococcales bacterium]
MYARLLVPGLLSALIALSCGASNLEAPPAEPRADAMQCQGIDHLMPNFVRAISEGRTEGLKHVVETQLLIPLREGDSPPVNDVLRAVFRTLDGYARKPPEAGAQGADYCAPTSSPPPLLQANELCEMRRAMDLLVHQGKGIDAIEIAAPQLNTALGYITGEGLDCKARPRTPHFEVSAAVAGMCSQTGQCQLNDGLDLLIGFTNYLATPDGQALKDHLNGLTVNPDGGSLTAFLNPSSLTEDEAVLLVRGLLPMLQAANSTELEDGFNSLTLPADLKADLRPVIDDLKKLLAREEIMGPLRRALNCIWGVDSMGRPNGQDSGKNYPLVRMVYRLALEEQCPEFGLTRLSAVLKGVQEVDSRGSLLYLAGTLAKAVRSDETAIDSAAIVCKTLFSTDRAAGEARSNAEQALPVAADLVKNGLINEGICAIDTLIFGCSGGAQPACR